MKPLQVFSLSDPGSVRPLPNPLPLPQPELKQSHGFLNTLGNECDN